MEREAKRARRRAESFPAPLPELLRVRCARGDARLGSHVPPLSASSALFFLPATGRAPRLSEAAPADVYGSHTSLQLLPEA